MSRCSGKGQLKSRSIPSSSRLPRLSRVGKEESAVSPQVQLLWKHREEDLGPGNPRRHCQQSDPSVSNSRTRSRTERDCYGRDSSTCRTIRIQRCCKTWKVETLDCIPHDHRCFRGSLLLRTPPRIGRQHWRYWIRLPNRQSNEPRPDPLGRNCHYWTRDYRSRKTYATSVFFSYSRQSAVKRVAYSDTV